MILKLFKNDLYDLLKLLYDSQIKVKQDEYAALSQQEMADILSFSKVKVNKMIKELKENNFIQNYKDKKSKYIITNDGLRVIEIFETGLEGK
ncbi:helix-turn-helix domain-containing protein [Oceanivirga miroungae]|uniref:Uncharacterized protein n=1 Tax=Oceanivirga miroungae TaxID=1130046 RepID=A0A6I8M8S4_9FUSO|nr:helix-turn-helix domain-containing protein [Oceanivirga miroungae]VWL85895.1 hypothetical protein OMES3154_01181 [Oceanivirga miroungae]